MALTRRGKWLLWLAAGASAGLTAWLVVTLTRPQGAYTYFTYDSFDDGETGEMQYALYVPPGHASSERLPLVVFLHGPEQRGADGRRPLTEGLGPVIAGRVRSGQPVGFIVLFPQSFTGSWDPHSEDGRLLWKVLARVKAHFPVDSDRVYLTGVSDGATGVWGLAAEHPGEWAAIVPVSGRASPTSAHAIRHIPCWCFQGGADKVVDPAETRGMIGALRSAGGNPRYTEYPGRGHDIWLKPYANPQLFDWLLSQHRPSAS
jgi:predicted peptidase